MRKWLFLLVGTFFLVSVAMLASRCGSSEPPAIPPTSAQGTIQIPRCTGEERSYTTTSVLVRQGETFSQERICLAVSNGARKRILTTLSSGLPAGSSPRLVRVSGDEYTVCGVPEDMGESQAPLRAEVVTCR